MSRDIEVLQDALQKIKRARSANQQLHTFDSLRAQVDALIGGTSMTDAYGSIIDTITTVSESRKRVDQQLDVATAECQKAIQRAAEEARKEQELQKANRP